MRKSNPSRFMTKINPKIHLNVKNVLDKYIYVYIYSVY